VKVGQSLDAVIGAVSGEFPQARVPQIPSPAEAEPQKIEGALKGTRMNFH
jgi:hypothetical protein